MINVIQILCGLNNITPAQLKTAARIDDAAFCNYFIYGKHGFTHDELLRMGTHFCMTADELKMELMFAEDRVLSCTEAILRRRSAAMKPNQTSVRTNQLPGKSHAW